MQLDVSVTESVFVPTTLLFASSAATVTLNVPAMGEGGCCVNARCVAVPYTATPDCETGPLTVAVSPVPAVYVAVMVYVPGVEIEKAGNVAWPAEKDTGPAPVAATLGVVERDTVPFIVEDVSSDVPFIRSTVMLVDPPAAKDEMGV